jgi:hypothetical protein
MPTDINISVGLNLEIGSIPVSLNASYDSVTSTFVFDGCVHDAVIDIGNFMGHVGQQFAVGQQLPPELQLEAIIDFVAGRVSRASAKDDPNGTTMEMGIAAKFTLKYPYNGTTSQFSFSFYADRVSDSKGNSHFVVGAAIDTDLQFKNLPLVGDVPGFRDYTLKHLGFSYTSAGVTDPNKPVVFNIPYVATTDNPLFTRGNSDPNAKTAKNYTIDTKADQTNFKLSNGGFSFTAGLMKEGSGNVENNFSLPMKLPPATGNPNLPSGYYNTGKPGLQSSPPDSPVHWININKTIGPVDIQKIGVNYKSGEASFGLSASLAVGGFDMDVQGLTITFPLPLPFMPAGKEISFDIQGLAMDYNEGGLSIGGAFMKVVDGEFTNYFGEVFVQVAEFGFKAIGGYSPAKPATTGPPPLPALPAAFFIYAKLDAPLGGPPFLYITGLAFGFGINYGLVLPTIDNITSYPLLHDAPPQGKNAADALTSVINDLESGKVIVNEPGEYWVAAGLQFTSFDMVTAFALVTVSFGVEVQVALLGTCAIILPEGDPYPIADVEIDLMASITPSTGLFAVIGVITPSSYILGPFVRLGGGFAFYIWFGAGNNPKENHKGDFVITLGGYHPSFVKPSHYPAVPRLKITFNLGPLQASGSTYIALTSSMFMAGMQFLATIDAGPLKAWFGAGADFLIGWAPFQYEADAYVNIGCSLDLGLFTITIDIGADLQLWGPAFGGKAELDLVIFSVTVHFGSTAAEPAPVSWKDLEKNFLPNTDSTKKTPKKLRAQFAQLGSFDEAPPVTNVSASVSPGLVGHNITQGTQKWDWLVDPDNFAITTASTIPINKPIWKQAATNPVVLSNNPNDYNAEPVDTSKQPYLELTPGTKTYSDTEVWDTGLHVKPMRVENIISQHTITLCKEVSGGVYTDYRSNVAIQPVLGKSNTALWGNLVPQTPDNPSGMNNDPNLKLSIEDSLIGFRIVPLPRNPDTVNAVPLYGLIFNSYPPIDFSYLDAQPVSTVTVSSSIDTNTDELLITLSGMHDEQIPNNDLVLNGLNDAWVVTQRNPLLKELNTFFGTYKADDVTLNKMASKQMLTDWPLVEVLGNPIPISS